MLLWLSAWCGRKSTVLCHDSWMLLIALWPSNLVNLLILSPSASSYKQIGESPLCFGHSLSLQLAGMLSQLTLFSCGFVTTCWIFVCFVVCFLCFFFLSSFNPQSSAWKQMSVKHIISLNSTLCIYQGQLAGDGDGGDQDPFPQGQQAGG